MMISQTFQKTHTHRATHAFLLVAALMTSSAAWCELAPLSNDELSAVQGAGTGVQFSINASINGSLSGTTWTPSPSCVTSTGAPGTASGFCRFGLQLNNQFNWVLLKDFNGYINIPQLILFGSTVTPATGLQSAVGLQINLPSPTNTTSQININNLAFNLALAMSPCYSYSGGAVASSCSISYGSVTGTAPTATQNQTTYYDSSTFQSSSSTSPFYSPADAGKETGIMSVRMNGNLNVGGTIYVFSK